MTISESRHLSVELDRFSDAARWNPSLSDAERHEIVKKSPPKKLNYDFIFSRSSNGRKFSFNFYTRELSNGD